ncbi:hypothetical protein OEA41_004711 [Lepraria neglecta]|uniref:Fe2OG dioxygenase domain-containing protein n=1 Tax=Lepraria neglecta TaxID=209136 RepID=A0AAE0DGD8_9LECA|nr:hypothetical protein OEA41_004711 [Lepraria neglecta]
MVVKLQTLDFADFTSGPAERREAVAKQLGNSFINHSFVKLINHGVPDALVQDLFAWSKKFFKLNREQKSKLPHVPNSGLQRGWSGKGSEQTAYLHKGNVGEIAPEHLVDEKEHFDCGPPNDDQHPNFWPAPEDLPGFRKFFEHLYTYGQTISLQIMKACEVGLNLLPGTLTARCDPAASEFRFNHNPAVSIEKLQQRLQKRTWPRTDLGIITLLFQDTVGELELEDRKGGGFSPVVREGDNEMVINISDTLQRWTNDCIRAGLHQVTNPVPQKDDEAGMLAERYSCVFFLKAHRETNVGALTTYIYY